MSAERYVAMMGGSDAIMIEARKDFAKGEYRWVAELLNHLVFAEPDHEAAKDLLAQTYDQMAYMAESGPWRDVYLTGALELRQGTPTEGLDLSNAIDLIDQTPVDQFFEAMAVMLNGPRANGKTFVLNINFTDLNENYVLELENAVLHQRKGSLSPDADATIHITHPLFVKMLTGGAGPSEVLFSDEISIEGSKLGLAKFFALLDQPPTSFNIVTP
jgi:alkyl sulfatase BDS1-like metallo-beta-lactamase superfamily hydrolase